MPHQTRRFARWLLAAMIGVFVASDTAWAAGVKQVLVLYSQRRDSQLASIADREISRALENGLKGDLDYYAEYIDQWRFSDSDSEAFRDYLELKYKTQRFDVVVAMNDFALRFGVQNRDRLFPGVPIVFVTRNASTRRVPNSVGLKAELNFARTIGLALELQPDLQQVFLVAGADQTDQAWGRVAREQLRPFETRLTVTELFGLPTAQLESRLAALPAHSIVYYLVAYKDGAGENLDPTKYLERVAAMANVPTYSWVDFAMDHGIVGGSLQDLNAEAAAVAALTLRVLGGEPADSIAMSDVQASTREVDWRQLRRWRISEARVPAGTLIKFRELSVWDRYKVYIVGAVLALLVQSALIAGLLVQRTRRRQAEHDARESQAELRVSYERIRDLGSRLLGAQETERARIARELHDDVSQQMALLEIDLDLLSNQVDGRAEALVDEALDRAHDIGKTVHELSHRLHPSRLTLMGLVPALHGLQHDLSQSDTSISISHENMPPALSSDLTLCVFRVVQEALQNAIKYSRSGQVAVQLSCHAQELVVTIADNGVGFDVNAAWGKGLGLISMRERLEALNGTLTIHSEPGIGTRLEVHIPLSAELDAEGVAV
jgi:signal transduction histidine kinase